MGRSSGVVPAESEEGGFMRILPFRSPYENEPFFFATAFPLSRAKGEEVLPLRSPNADALSSPRFFFFFFSSRDGGNYFKRSSASYAKRKINVFKSRPDAFRRFARNKLPLCPLHFRPMSNGRRGTLDEVTRLTRIPRDLRGEGRRLFFDGVSRKAEVGET